VLTAGTGLGLVVAGEPDLLKRRLWVLYGVIHDLAHPVEPEGGTVKAALSPGSGRAGGLIRETELKLTNFSFHAGDYRVPHRTSDVLWVDKSEKK
jgi:hypothetical protein